MLQNITSMTPLIALAILPSLIWMFFYLKEDMHPEPRFWLFAIFLIGMALAPLVISLEMATDKLFDLAAIPLGGLLIFVFAPIIEELAKYGVVHLALNKNPVLDEPVDGMIYVIVSALGFAAIENIFAIFSFVSVGAPGYFTTAFNFVSVRFISAVALHGLASGIAGYYFARFYFPSKANMKRNPLFIFLGLFLASLLHGAYNFLIIKNDSYLPLMLAGAILGISAVFVIFLFIDLKRRATYQQTPIDSITKDKV